GVVSGVQRRLPQLRIAAVLAVAIPVAAPVTIVVAIAVLITITVTVVIAITIVIAVVVTARILCVVAMFECGAVIAAIQFTIAQPRAVILCRVPLSAGTLAPRTWI